MSDVWEWQQAAPADSLIAPLLIGFRPTPDVSVHAVYEATAAATNSIPLTIAKWEQVKGMKTYLIPCTRRVVFTTEDKSYAVLARCGDQPPNGDLKGAWGHWCWEAGVYCFNDETSAALVGEGRKAARLDVTRFVKTKRGLHAAPQLALFRHLIVEGLRAIDPQLTVAGGQCHWRDEWWS